MGPKQSPEPTKRSLSGTPLERPARSSPALGEATTEASAASEPMASMGSAGGEGDGGNGEPPSGGFAVPALMPFSRSASVLSLSEHGSRPSSQMLSHRVR